MPNECWNTITLTGVKEEIDLFVMKEFKDVPEWAHKIIHRGEEGILFRIWSRWEPDYKWLEGLLQQYTSFWIKNSWHEEGGGEGVWIGQLVEGVPSIKRMEWYGMCIEEAAHRFRDPPEPAKLTYHIVDEKETIRGTFIDLHSLMKFQDMEQFGKKWCIQIEEIGYKRVEEFPDFKDVRVRKAFALDA
jgi:hypothetical protein